jgi:hypothetical protein
MGSVTSRDGQRLFRAKWFFAMFKIQQAQSSRGFKVAQSTQSAQ